MAEGEHHTVENLKRDVRLRQKLPERGVNVRDVLVEGRGTASGDLSETHGRSSPNTPVVGDRVRGKVGWSDENTLHQWK